jgi:hypothetical protein
MFLFALPSIASIDIKKSDSNTDSKRLFFRSPQLNMEPGQLQSETSRSGLNWSR